MRLQAGSERGAPASKVRRPGLSRCSCCLTRTRMRRGIGTRAAAAQQLHSERQPAPTATHHKKLLAGPPSARPLCPHMDFAAPAREQRAAPCTTHRSHKTSGDTHHTCAATAAPPSPPSRCRRPPRTLFRYTSELLHRTPRGKTVDHEGFRREVRGTPPFCTRAWACMWMPQRHSRCERFPGDGSGSLT